MQKLTNLLNHPRIRTFRNPHCFEPKYIWLEWYSLASMSLKYMRKGTSQTTENINTFRLSSDLNEVCLLMQASCI